MLFEDRQVHKDGPELIRQTVFLSKIMSQLSVLVFVPQSIQIRRSSYTSVCINSGYVLQNSLHIEWSETLIRQHHDKEI